MSLLKCPFAFLNSSKLFIVTRHSSLVTRFFPTVNYQILLSFVTHFFTSCPWYPNFIFFKLQTCNSIRGFVRPLVRPFTGPSIRWSKSGKTSVLDAFCIEEFVDRAGVVRPCPTVRKQYCDPASLVVTHYSFIPHLSFFSVSKTKWLEDQASRFFSSLVLHIWGEDGTIKHLNLNMVQRYSL